MRLFRRKSAEELDDVDTEGVEIVVPEDSDDSDEDTGRVYDPTFKEKAKFYGRKVGKGMRKGMHATKVGAIKAGSKVKGAYKYAFTENLYPKYEPTEVGKVGHHDLFTGKGYRDFAWICKWLFIVYPPALLMMAPMYAVYGAETTYGGYMAVKSRKHKKYEKGRPLNYREQVRKNILEKHKVNVANRRARRAERRDIRHGETFDRESRTDRLVEEIGSGASVE